MVASSSNLLSSVVATLVSWIISVFGITFASMGTPSIRTFCRNTSPVLDQPAATLNTLQRIYLQFYRGLMGKKRYLLLSGHAEIFDPQVTREFLTEANHALQQTESCLLVLTTDQSLLSANPQNAWQQPPVLSLHAVTK